MSTLLRPPVIEPPPRSYRHAFNLRVRFGDTDAAGIVYYANYLRYFEAGRAELMRAAGLPYADTIEQEDVVMPVVDCWARYHAPAVYDDLLTIRTWIHEVRASSMLIGTTVSRDDVLLVSGGTRLGCVSRTGRPRRLPARIREFLAPRER